MMMADDDSEETTRTKKRKKPIARAVYKFEGESEQELSFSPGEAVLLIKRVDENWLEGELDGRIGIFPANRVRVELGSPSLAREIEPGRTCGVALRNFPGECEGDLPLEEGQVVELLGSVGAGWSRGRLKGRVGIFPESFVEVLDVPQVENNDTVNVVKPQPKPRASKPLPKPRSRSNKIICRETSENIGGILKETGVDSIAATTDSTSFADISVLEDHLSELQSSLDKEEKLLLSAQSLLKICQIPGKKEKLQQTVLKHQQSVERLFQELQSTEEKRNEILNKSESVPGTPPTTHNSTSNRTSKSVPGTPPTPPNSTTSRKPSTHSKSVPGTPPTPSSSTPRKLFDQSKPVSDTPPSPSSSTSKKSSDDEMSMKRQKAKEELIETEKGFYTEVSTFCYEVLPAFKLWYEISWEELFSNIEDISDLSKKICKAFEEPECKVGGVYKRFAPEIKSVYGVYCRNHDHASQLLEKFYEEKSGNSDKVKKVMELGKPTMKSWDLHTLLIKPVQRVLKYNLLLEQLLKYTSKIDEEYTELSEVVKLSSKVAQDINELKRRKDILERYTGSGRDERKINLGTMRKKVRRLTQTLTQKTGLRTATVDPKYDKEETQILSLESALRTLQVDIMSSVEERDRLFAARDSLLNTMSDYAVKSIVLNAKGLLIVTMKEKWKTHRKSMQEKVYNPLTTLIGYFHDPLLLMNKRGDKLLDYDSLQHDMEKCTEQDKIQQLKESVTLAKRTYEALNTQLLEDLPKFTEKVTLALTKLLTVYLREEISFHEQMCDIFTQSASPSTANLSDSSIIEFHLDSLQNVFQDISTLSILPSSLTTSFGFAFNTQKTIPRTVKSDVVLNSSRSSLKRRSMSVQHIPPPGPFARKPSPIYEEIPELRNLKKPMSLNSLSVNDKSPPQYNEPVTNSLPLQDYENAMEDDDTPTNSDHEYIIPPDALRMSSPDSLLQSPPPSLALSPFSDASSCEEDVPAGTELIALYDFEAESSAELSLQEGDVVSLVCPHDSEGSRDWWLVELSNDRVQQQGYVPYNFFKVSTRS